MAVDVLALFRSFTTKIGEKLNDLHTRIETALLLGEDVAEVQSGLENLSGYINGAFKDGIVDQNEVDSIRKYINSLENEKADLDSKFSVVHGNPFLPSLGKTTLATDKGNYDTAHSALIFAIEQAIADGKATPQEQEEVDTKFTEYRQELAGFSESIENALQQIASGRIDAVELGGRNLAFGTGEAFVKEEFQNAFNKITPLYELNQERLDSGKYALSLDLSNDVVIGNQAAARLQLQLTDSEGIISYHFLTYLPLTNGDHRIEVLLDSFPEAKQIELQLRTDYVESGVISISNFQLEKGTKVMDWKPAPEDISKEIDTVAAAKALQERIIAEAHADDRITVTEEELLILADQSVEAAYRVSEAKAALAETNSKAWADGKITDEEAARIAEAQAKYNAAINHANTIKGNLEVLINQAREEAELAMLEAQNAKQTGETLAGITNWLTTDINGNVVASGTFAIGSAGGAQGGMTGVVDAGLGDLDSVRLWFADEFANRYTAPFSMTGRGLMTYRDPDTRKKVFEIGVKDGKVVINIYDEDENLKTVLGPGGGFQQENYKPETYRRYKMVYAANTRTVTNAQVQSFFENNAYKVYGPNQDYYFNFSEFYRYDAGNTPYTHMNQQYNGMYFGSMDITYNHISNGWYYKWPGMYERASNNQITMRLYYIENGKETGESFLSQFTINPADYTP